MWSSEGHGITLRVMETYRWGITRQAYHIRKVSTFLFTAYPLDVPVPFPAELASSLVSN